MSYLGEMPKAEGAKADTMARDEAYKQAEKKIEEALQSGATKLTIWYPFIFSLPVDNPIFTKGGRHDD